MNTRKFCKELISLPLNFVFSSYVILDYQARRKIKATYTLRTVKKTLDFGLRA